jgi:MoaA/NifB/PqqE/SkfB family radical SAM enzyme
VEPDRQIEIQLGHMCNNRCVFCVSGQRTAMGEAGPMPVGPILARIREARERGHHKITLLGGEPTLQPGFLEIVEETVALGFEEIVLFTNGAKTARPEFIDAIRATGGRFTWRISIQGATCESHERTTRKPGSFGRIVRTLEHLRERGERITVNMCVVTSNFEDVDAFPELLLPYGVQQLHLDMMRPLDAGKRTEEELRATLPRYSAMAEPFRRMVHGFPEGFDVNVGNLPYCIAPDLAPWIHHDGQRTDTIAIDGDDQLSRPWNKYLVKRRDKLKPASCRRCVFDSRCSGVFETYARFYGLDELQPVDATTARGLDPLGRMVGVWAPPLLAGSDAEGELDAASISESAARLTAGDTVLELRPAAAAAGAIARYGGVTVHHVGGPSPSPEALGPLLARLGPPVHPLGPPVADPRLAAGLRRLRAGAPFGPLCWSAIDANGSRVEVTLDGPDGERAVLWLERAGGGGYRVEGEPTAALEDGLREAMRALRRAPKPGPARAPSAPRS